MSKITIYFITLLTLPFFYVGLILALVFYGAIWVNLPIPPILLQPLEWLDLNAHVDLTTVFATGVTLYLIAPMACITQALVIALLLGNKIIWPWGNVPLNQSLWAILWGCIYLSLVTLGVLMTAAVILI